MISTSDHTSATPEAFVTDDPNLEFVNKLRDIVANLHVKLNEGLLDPNTLVGLGICAVQMQGLTTCLFTDSADKPVNPGLRMAASILHTCLQDEADNRVALLLKKAQSLTEQAIKIRTGEIITSTLH